MKLINGSARTRTADLLITNQLLYQLSYKGIISFVLRFLILSSFIFILIYMMKTIAALFDIFKLSIFLFIAIFTEKSVYFFVCSRMPNPSEPNNKILFPFHLISLNFFYCLHQNHKSKNFFSKELKSGIYI